MCLAIPAKVLSLDGMTAEVERYGERLTIDLTLLAEKVAVGDYVIIQARRFAVERMDAETAAESLRLFDEIIDTLDAADGKPR